MNSTWPMRIGFIIAVVPLALLAVAGISFILGNGDFDNSAEHWVWRAFFVASPLIGGLGLWLCATRPGLGMALVLVGVGASAFVMPWMAPITVPVGIAIIAFAVKRSGLAIWPFRSSASGPTGTGAA